MSVVRGQLAAAVAGSGATLAVVGEAGLGKSRLAREVAGLARAAGMIVLTGRAVLGPGAGPFRPITEVLLQAMRSGVPADDPGLAPWLPSLAALAPGIVGPVGGVVGVAGQDAAAIRGEALVRVLRWRSGSDPLLLILEDLHWADPETLGIVEYLADNIAADRVLLVATVRDESSAALALVRRLHQRGAAALVTLGPLEPDAVEEMIRACAPEADLALVQRVQLTAEGVPLLVEEVLAAPGVPATIGETVRSRAAALGPDDRAVLVTAAVLGRDFDWRLLPRITGLPADRVTTAMEALVAAMLVDITGDGFRFRHILVREALVESIVPPHRIQIAREALAALTDDDPSGVYPELALLAGDRTGAGRMLESVGRDALRAGAVDTAVDTLRRASDLLAGPERRTACVALVDALALAGRLDEAERVAGPVLAELAPTQRQGVHLDLAAAAVEAGRWDAARRHLDAVPAAGARPDVAARAGVLAAEIALAGGDPEDAAARAEAAAAMADADAAPEVVCHALQLIGRSRRIRDLDGAGEAFQRAYAVADTAGLAIPRLRALHELGTIDLLDHGGSRRLEQARHLAGRLGLLHTVAVLDLQLSGAYLQQFDLVSALRSATRAETLAAALHQDRTRAMAYVFVACTEALRDNRDAVRAAAAAAVRLAPHDPEVRGFTEAGGSGMAELCWGSRDAALAALARGVTTLNGVAHSAPGPYRGLWPLLVAVQRRAEAPGALAAVWDSGVAVNRVNRGYLAYADAVLRRSTDAIAAGDRDLAAFPVWQHIGRMLAAEAALADQWGRPGDWLREAGVCFSSAGLGHLAQRCARLAGEADHPVLASLTPREHEVLDLLVRGMANREIAERLRLSVRTVEKHIESMLRKSGARSRAHLAALVRETT